MFAIYVVLLQHIARGVVVKQNPHLCSRPNFYNKTYISLVLSAKQLVQIDGGSIHGTTILSSDVQDFAQSLIEGKLKLGTEFIEA